MKKWRKAIKRKGRVVNEKKYEHDLHLRLDQKTDELLQRNLDRTNEQRKKKINQSEYVRQLICRFGEPAKLHGRHWSDANGYIEIIKIYLLGLMRRIKD